MICWAIYISLDTDLWMVVEIDAQLFARDRHQSDHPMHRAAYLDRDSSQYDSPLPWGILVATEMQMDVQPELTGNDLELWIGMRHEEDALWPRLARSCLFTSHGRPTESTVPGRYCSRPV